MMKSLLEEIPASWPMEKALNKLNSHPEWRKLMPVIFQSYPALRELLVSPLSLLPVLVETRSSLGDLENRAQHILSDKNTLELFPNLKYQVFYAGLPSRAALASDDALMAMQSFTRKDGGATVFKMKRTGQAMAIFLAGRRSREAVRAFMAGLDPTRVMGTVLTEESPDISAFWYNLPAVYQKLREAGETFEEAGSHLAYWAYHYHKMPTKVRDSQSKWEDWLYEREERLADYLDEESVNAVATYLHDIRSAAAPEPGLGIQRGALPEFPLSDGSSKKRERVKPFTGGFPGFDENPSNRRRFIHRANELSDGIHEIPTFEQLERALGWDPWRIHLNGPEKKMALMSADSLEMGLRALSEIESGKPANSPKVNAQSNIVPFPLKGKSLSDEDLALAGKLFDLFQQEIQAEIPTGKIISVTENWERVIPRLRSGYLPVFGLAHVFALFDFYIDIVEQMGKFPIPLEDLEGFVKVAEKLVNTRTISTRVPREAVGVMQMLHVRIIQDLVEEGPEEGEVTYRDYVALARNALAGFRLNHNRVISKSELIERVKLLAPESVIKSKKKTYLRDPFLKWLGSQPELEWVFYKEGRWYRAEPNTYNPDFKINIFGIHNPKPPKKLRTPRQKSSKRLSGAIKKNLLTLFLAATTVAALGATGSEHPPGSPSLMWQIFQWLFVIAFFVWIGPMIQRGILALSRYIVDFYERIHPSRNTIPPQNVTEGLLRFLRRLTQAQATNMLADRDAVTFDEWPDVASRLGVKAPNAEQIALFIQLHREVSAEKRSGALPANTDVTQEVIVRLEKMLAKSDSPPSFPSGGSSSEPATKKLFLRAA